MTTYVGTGDSQAEGLFAADALPRVLGDRLVYHEDHRGWSSRRLLEDSAIQNAAGRAAATDSKMLVFAGGNDPAPTTPEGLEQYKATLADIAKTIARKSAATNKRIDVIWFGPVYARVAPDSRQHPEVARAQGAIFGSSFIKRAIASVPGAQVTIRWVDSQPLTRDLAIPTNVHLTLAGYRTFAERVGRSLDGGGLFGLALLGGAAYAGWRYWRRAS